MAKGPPLFGPEHRTLDGINILMEAPPGVAADIHGKCHWLEFDEGDVIVDVNDASTDVFFIVQGEVRAMDFITDDQQVALADLAAGESFGELSAIDLQARSARITALQPTLLAVISSRDFRALLMECPGIGLALLKRFAGFIRSLNMRITAMSTMTPHQRIYFELLRLSEPDVADEAKWVVTNVPNHTEIASWVGAERQTVAEAIGRLAREGVVERHHKNLVIKDHKRLQRLVDRQ